MVLFKGRYLILIVLVILGALVSTVFWFTTSREQTAFYVNALPRELETVGFVDAGSDASIFSGLAFQREFCGSVIYQLSDDTVAQIYNKGILFFENAKQERGSVGTEFYAYQTWKQTPLGVNSGESLLAMGLDCKKGSRIQNHEIIKAAYSSGAFYTYSREAVLVVIPSM